MSEYSCKECGAITKYNELESGMCNWCAGMEQLWCRCRSIVPILAEGTDYSVSKIAIYAIEKLEKQNEILRDAVEFYAMTSSWGGDGRLGSDIDEGDCQYIEKWYESIGGKQAREALEKLKDLE